MTATFLALTLVLTAPDADALRKQIRSDQANIRKAVFEQLELEELIGPVKLPADLLLDLLPPLEDGDAGVRKAATAFWTNQATRALPALMQGMEDARVPQRSAAARAVPLIHAKLGKPEATKAIQQLERQLFDSHPAARRAAADALGQLKALP